MNPWKPFGWLFVCLATGQAFVVHRQFNNDDKKLIADQISTDAGLHIQRVHIETYKGI